jgi:hypothetical protein
VQIYNDTGGSGPQGVSNGSVLHYACYTGMVVLVSDLLLKLQQVGMGCKRTY